MSMTVVSLTCLKATHEPSARTGLSVTPAAVTCRLPRGSPTLYAPSGCSAPGLPSPWSTCFQSMSASGRCACPSMKVSASPARAHAAACRILPPRRGASLHTSGADARWVVAVPDAVQPPVRLRRVVRGPGFLFDQPRPDCVTNRHPADPDAGRGHGGLPLPHDASRPDREAAHADRRCLAHGGRRPGLRLHP